MRRDTVSNGKTYPRRDWLNVGILIVLFVFVLLLIPPAHQYSVMDDWTYAHSVQDMVRLNYSPSEWSMATALSHVAWGAVFVWLFGFSFTVLTASNLVMSIAGIILFYLLLRQLEVTPTFALFGALILFLNPIYIYLSYSYMSDIAFVTYSTAALLCYVIGVKRKSQHNSFYWLVAGSLFTSLAYLDRQLGAILIAVIVCYLLWESPRRVQYGRIAAAILLPCAATVSYAVWESNFDSSLVAYVQAGFRASIFSNFVVWLMYRAVLLTWATFLLGLISLPLLSLQVAKTKRIRLLSLMLPFIVLFYLLVVGYQHNGSWVPTGLANIADSSGFLMLNYNSAPLFNDTVWFVLCIVSAVSISILISALIYRTAKWKPLRISSVPDNTSPLMQSTNGQDQLDVPGEEKHSVLFRITRSGRRLLTAPPHPKALVYLFGLVTFITTAAFSYVTTDRYWLPVLPALITFAVANIATSKTEGAQASVTQHPSILRWSLVGAMAIATVVGQQDYMAHATLRWNAGEQLLAQGTPPDKIYMGDEWTGWYVSDEGLQYFLEHHDAGTGLNPALAVVDPVFMASDIPVDGYTVIRTLTYPSLLRGGQGQVLILERESAR